MSHPLERRLLTPDAQSTAQSPGYWKDERRLPADLTMMTPDRDSPEILEGAQAGTSQEAAAGPGPHAFSGTPASPWLTQ